MKATNEKNKENTRVSKRNFPDSFSAEVIMVLEKLSLKGIYYYARLLKVYIRKL